VRLLREMGCVDTEPAVGTTRRVRASGGSDARLQLQYYVNHLLTWLAAEGVVACAIRHLQRLPAERRKELGVCFEPRESAGCSNGSEAPSSQPAGQPTGVGGGSQEGQPGWTGWLFAGHVAADAAHGGGGAEGGGAGGVVGGGAAAAAGGEVGSRVGLEPGGGVDVPVVRAELERAMRWLMQLLGGELTTLLGPPPSSFAHVAAALRRLEAGGGF
jgi:hypothetical protein